MLLSTFPNDLIHEIYAHLQVPDVAHLGMTCATLHSHYHTSIGDILLHRPLIAWITLAKRYCLTLHFLKKYRPQIITYEYLSNPSITTETFRYITNFSCTSPSQAISYLNILLSLQSYRTDILEGLREDIDWGQVSNLVPLNGTVNLLVVADDLDWTSITLRCPTTDVLWKCRHYIRWQHIAYDINRYSADAFVDQFEDFIDWPSFSQKGSLTEYVAVIYKDRIDWTLHEGRFTEIPSPQLLHEIQEVVDWSILLYNWQFPESTLDMFSPHFNQSAWSVLSAMRMYPSLSEDFLRRHEDQVDWRTLARQNPMRWSPRFLGDYGLRMTNFREVDSLLECACHG